MTMLSTSDRTVCLPGGTNMLAGMLALLGRVLNRCVGAATHGLDVLLANTSTYCFRGPVTENMLTDSRTDIFISNTSQSPEVTVWAIEWADEEYEVDLFFQTVKTLKNNNVLYGTDYRFQYENYTIRTFKNALKTLRYKLKNALKTLCFI